jgi:glycosyltransferase involved in cell wall biosynthesis
MKNQLVSVIIPGKNSGSILENCLKSLREQSYKNLEIIVVDSYSKDSTKSVAEKYKAKLLNCNPKVKTGMFDAPYKRNFGAKKAKGEFVYYVDADMELTKNVIKEAVETCQLGYDGAILKEDSFGEGVWARAKNLERRCYWGDDTVEAPRFFRKKVWDDLGGLDESLGGGGDDWDFYQKFLEGGYKVVRTKSVVMHNEGNLKLTKLIKKRFMYGRDSFRYIVKRPVAGAKSYFPIRKAYIRNWKLFFKRPFDTGAFLVMRSAEYLAGASGVLYSLVVR